MKQLFFIICTIILVNFQPNAWADEDGAPKLISDKAVIAADKDKGFKLSEPAVKRLGITYETLNEAKIFKVPSGAIVYHESEAGIYIVKEGWFKLVDVEIEKFSGKDIFISSTSLNNGLKVVVSGVPLLRIAELDAFGGTQDMD